MSLNLTVPTDAVTANAMGSSSLAKPRVQRRAKSPVAGSGGHPATGGSGGGSKTHRNSGISVSAGRNIRAKSKSPNPSFCSVLSRVKDWELGAFTPKTALPNHNLGDSDTSNSDVSNNLLCPSNDPDQRSAATPWRNDGSPEPKQGEENSGAKLMKSNLSSNIGKSTS